MRHKRQPSGASAQHDRQIDAWAEGPVLEIVSPALMTGLWPVIIWPFAAFMISNVRPMSVRHWTPSATDGVRAVVLPAVLPDRHATASSYIPFRRCGRTGLARDTGGLPGRTPAGCPRQPASTPPPGERTEPGHHTAADHPPRQPAAQRREPRRRRARQLRRPSRLSMAGRPSPA
jgi:hypothetical protein